MEIRLFFLITLSVFVKTDDSDNLEYIYNELSSVYGQYSNKTFFLTPEQWEEWTLPKDPGKRATYRMYYSNFPNSSLISNFQYPITTLS